MAHLYKRTGSPFWWIKFRDPANGLIVRQSTGFRIGRKDETDKAYLLESEKTTDERRSATARHASRFENWVEGFIEHHYANPLTLSRVRATWKLLQSYLHEIGVHHPEHLRREHCLNYLDWRLNRGHRNSPGDRKLSRNTVILELKFLGKVMSEAVNREWIEYNVAYRLGIKRARAKERAEMTDAHADIIRQEIARLKAIARNEADRLNADFLHLSFEIANAQGIRLHETHFHLRDQVDTEAQTLTLRAKGKDDLVQPINPDLLPLLESLIAEGREWTYRKPRMPSLQWAKLFKRLRAIHPELQAVSFHSTRVRVISRLERAGAPEPAVKKLVNHASTTVHRIYRRVKREELAPYWSALRSGPTSPPPASACPPPEPPIRKADEAP